MLQQTEDLDAVFQALADATRRAIVDRLVEGPASVSELAAPFSMTLTGTLQHVQVLEASGLVRTRKEGRTRICRLEPATLHRAEQWISERRDVWERRYDRLGELLDATTDTNTQPGKEHR